MTLAQMAATKQTPMMMDAIKFAMQKYGENAEATYATGQVSYRRGSNAYWAASRMGAKVWDCITGPRAGRRRTEGYRMVVVKVD